MSAIAHPQVATLLLMLGTLGLTVELWNPGAVLPGVVGGLCLLLAFFAFQFVPVSTAGLLLIVFGIALLIIEIKVPSFGVLGLGGILSLAVGSLMLPGEVPGVALRPALVVSVALAMAAILLVLGRLAMRAHRQPASTGVAAMIGLRGRALAAFEPGRPTQVAVRGEIWNATAETPLAEGEAGHYRRRGRPDAARGAGKRTRGRSFVMLTPGAVFLLLVVFYVLSSIKILREYERGVIFRLGKLLAQPKGPGVVLVFAPIDRIVRVSLRTVVLDVPPQDIITRDNVSVKVNAVVFFRVVDPRMAIVEVENFNYATSQLAQTTLRSVLGQAELDDLLAQRERLNQQLQQILDHQTDPWGVKVSAVEVKHVDLPADMQRAIARQAEAEREKRAKIIHAEGELIASEKLSQAAAVMNQEPLAITLRYLQTLTEISAEKNSTIIFPLPIDLLQIIRQKV